MLNHANFIKKLAFSTNSCGQRQQQNSAFAWNQEFWDKIDVFPKIMTISTDLAISNTISSFVPKYWLNWQILEAISNKWPSGPHF